MGEDSAVDSGEADSVLGSVTLIAVLTEPQGRIENNSVDSGVAVGSAPLTFGSIVLDIPAGAVVIGSNDARLVMSLMESTAEVLDSSTGVGVIIIVVVTVVSASSPSLSFLEPKRRSIRS